MVVNVHRNNRGGDRSCPPEKLYGLKPESCMSPEILKSVCNISRCLSDNETKQADNCVIKSRSLSNDAMV